ncbi:MAG TPA: penicillin-binding protein 2 [Amnibacterium sp.]|jgi:cell division protein FtsI (penicillin-binding protein 3)|uniref:peptidoglycan D,D-transpeptidase FtsI family protein n=1 Tax=Amnibacterium sp. TaxID=1872496 RepID=UPI002F92F094
MRRTRRAARLRPAIVLLLVVVSAAVFLVHLVDVQVVHASALRAESKDRRSQRVDVPGVRGDILDASGVQLATTVPRYTITASPRLAAAGGGVPAAGKRIAAALGVGSAAIVGRLTADPTSDYAVVARSVTLAALTKVKALDVPWLYYQQTGKRVYPSGAVAGNIVGFVGAQGQPQAGLEYSDNACLAGSDGVTQYESALDGTAIPGSAVVEKAAKPGGTVRLTIDRDLQWYAQQVLAARAKQTGAKWGSVVVEEVATGKLLAVADWPTVDPNDVNATASRDTAALGSRAFTAPFEPGSTMKSITSAALLDAGLATPRSEVTAPYRLVAGGANVNDSEYHGAERLTLTGVLVQSSNTGMSLLGSRMADAMRYRYLQRFGFGTPTDVRFGAEASGDLGVGAPRWDPQSRLATMFGQGLTTTAVQMASAYATIANGGVKEPVRLVDSCTAADGTVTKPAVSSPSRVVSASAARSTVSMLENVATKGWLAADVRIPGYRVGIKTGTAQESDGRGSYAKGFLVSMAGVAPADHPKYVVYVDLDAPSKMNTSQATAPVLRQVMARVLQQHDVVPSGTRSPDLPTSW